MGNQFNEKVQVLLAYLNKEKEKIKSEIIEIEDSKDFFDKSVPVIFTNEDAEQYNLLLTKIIEWIIVKTKDGFFKEEKVSEAINLLQKTTTQQLGDDDWKKYLTIYFNGKTKKISVMTTKYGAEIWRQKDENGTGERCAEGLKASSYWYKVKAIIEDYYIDYVKNNKI